MKIVVTLTQDPGAQSYTVQTVEGTVQLSIGQSIPRETVERWTVEFKNVRVRIVGITEPGESGDQLDLIPQSPQSPQKSAQSKTPKIKNVVIDKPQLTIAK